ncbi:MAG: hypothetical protein H6550_15955 [Chitinophagales bacterium]|nr:hypothetical protein [Chitinophagales bacterium]
MDTYLVVPDSIVEENNGKINNDKGLIFVKDNYGRWVINTSATNDWPDIDWGSMEVVTLTIDDFPIDTE